MIDSEHTPTTPPTPHNGDARRGGAAGGRVLWISLGALILAAVIVLGLIVLPRLDGGDIKGLGEGDDGTAPAPAQTEAQPAPAAKPGDCRTFSQEVTIDGTTRTVHGKACLREDGRWEIVEPAR